MPATPRPLLAGLLTRRQRWGLTLRGWLALTLLLAAGGTLAVRSAYPFLAPTHPVATRVLVAEGFIGDEGYRQVAEAFASGGYEKLYVTGGPLDLGSYLSGYQNLAQVAGQSLRKLGVPAAAVVEVPATPTRRDRTYASARALRVFFDENHLSIDSFNLFTSGSHARRSQLLYAMAFKKRADVGVIALPEAAFDSARWWTSSAGFRVVLSELIAYPYALFFRYSRAADF